ncbi:hypothetical protein Hanom_Chr06g00523851 [Helianthus anomalus]
MRRRAPLEPVYSELTRYTASVADDVDSPPLPPLPAPVFLSLVFILSPSLYISLTSGSLCLAVTCRHQVIVAGSLVCGR